MGNNFPDSAGGVSCEFALDAMSVAAKHNHNNYQKCQECGHEDRNDVFVALRGLDCIFVHFLLAVFWWRYQAFADGDGYVLNFEVAAVYHAVDCHFRKAVKP